MTITRRQFAGTLLGAAAATRSAVATVSAADDFTIAFIPDSQHLVERAGCVSVNAFSSLMQWVIDRQPSWNIRAIFGVGDTQQNSNAASVYGSQSAYAGAGYAKAWAANIPAIPIAGNHDYASATNVQRAQLGYQFHTGAFSPSNLYSAFGSSGMRITGSRSDRCFFGPGTSAANAIFDESTVPAFAAPASSANAFYRLYIGSIKWLVFALELHPRQVVIDWMKSICAVYADHQVIILSHSYITDAASAGVPLLVARGTGNTNTNIGGPDAYLQGAYPNSTSGVEQWDQFKTMPQLVSIHCGHWVGVTGYYQQYRRQATDGHYVLETFSDWQELDLTCAAGANAAHVMFLKYRPASGTVETYAYSVNKGQWITSGDRTYGANATALASVPFAFQSPDAPTFSGSAAISGTLR